MVIFQLVGGLGNQMFAHAAARSLSLQRSLRISFDFDCPYPHIKYEYALDVFALAPRPASAADLRRLKPKRGLTRRLYRLVGASSEPHLVRERREFTFDPAFFSIPDESYVSGYFQSAKYFESAADAVRADFAFRQPAEGRNAELLSKITTSESVAVHVRRGDYVAVAKTNALHGLCTVDYYRNGFATIERSVTKPVYFFFSNDIEWVRANLSTRHEHYFVDHNTGARSHEDLRLMSHCRHNIIANSSFSWWGAWLNANREKIVVAPGQWMINVDTPDLLPEEWIKL